MSRARRRRRSLLLSRRRTARRAIQASSSLAESSVTHGSKPSSLATLLVHGGRDAALPDEAVASPLYQSVNFHHPVGTAEGMRYPRYGNNPNAELVQRRLALLEGAEAGLVLASGQGATACALLALLRAGDHLLASSWLYGGTHQLIAKELPTMGIATTLVDPMETPVNPTGRVLDLAPITALAKELG